MQGILPLNKPKNMSSFLLVKILRRITKVKKIGHTGTLDPLATGVMIMLVGRNYTKKAPLFAHDDKEYRATFQLGIETDTYDLEGTVFHTCNATFTPQEIQKAVDHFQGDMMQIPPMFSAKKIEGKRLYQLARKGIEVERQPSPIHVSSKLVSYEYPLVTIDFTVSKGTYIRSLAHDFGRFLDSCAALYSLERIRAGSFHITECLDVDHLSLDLIEKSLTERNPCSA